MNTRHVAWIVACFAGAACFEIVGLAADAVQKVATVRSDVETLLPAGKYPRPLKCDSHGYMFMLGPEPNSGAATGLAGIQVTRVDAAGKLVATFPPQLPSGVEGPARYVDFAGDGKGGLIALINSLEQTGGVPTKRSGPYLARFRADGDLETIGAIDVGDRLVPSHLEVLPTGQLLVTGIDRIDRSASSIIFDYNGRNPVKVEGTARLEKGMSGDAVAALRESVRQGSIAVGNDGNVYVVGRSNRPAVLVIASNGQLLRYFVVRPPAPDLIAIGAQQNGTLLAIAFAPKNSTAATAIRLVDTTTREVQADYALGDSLKGQLACYASNGSFTILVTEGQGDKFRLKTVAP